MTKPGSSHTKSPPSARHAFVGGWSQRRGDFVSLLLGVRQGRRRKLTYIGEVKTDPFVEQPPEHPNHSHHWISPDLVAEIEFEGWTRDGTLGKAALKAVTDRPSFRHANWIALPK